MKHDQNSSALHVCYTSPADTIRLGWHQSLRTVSTVALCVLTCAWTIPVLAAIPASERAVLTALYVDSNGGQWSNNASWCIGTCPANGTPDFNNVGTECTWQGITCDGAQTHVIGIDLQSNNLAGTLPELNPLTSLASFDVFNNQLRGSIPDLAGLAALQYFDASNNTLSGSIPALAGLTNLRNFVVDSNDSAGPGLSGSLPSLDGLTNLQVFVAFNNSLSGSIPSLMGLTALTDFAVNDNFLTGSIPALAGLTALQDFVVYENALTGPIPALDGLDALQIFKIHGNQLTGSIPAAPGSLLAGQSTLCPNPLDISPSVNDAGWDAATGITPWWGGGVGSGCGDVIFANGFEAP